MSIVIIMIFGAMGLLGIGVVYAFYWAATQGQFSNLAVSSQTIFDSDEPVGCPTDRFPGEAWAAGQKDQTQTNERIKS